MFTKFWHVPTIHLNSTENACAQHCFAVVADVEKYPEFLPFCKEIKILNYVKASNKNLKHSSNTTDSFNALVILQYKKLTYEYTCQVYLDYINLILEVISNQGPIKQLIVRWQFNAIGPDNMPNLEPKMQKSTNSNMQNDVNLTEILFDMRCEIKNPLLNPIVSKMMKVYAKNIMQCFRNRLYNTTKNI